MTDMTKYTPPIYDEHYAAAKKPDAQASECCDLLVCDHDWGWIDESFDHEFGTEQAGHYECVNCGEIRDGQYEPEYFDDDVI